MPYISESVRFTLDCDICGLIEKRDLDVGPDPKDAAINAAKVLNGWGNVITKTGGRFCCPGCQKEIEQLVTQRTRAQAEASALVIANCVHDYQQRGFLMQCTKCQHWR